MENIKIAQIGPSWISEQNSLNNSESLCRSNPSDCFGSIRLKVWMEMLFEEISRLPPWWPSWIAQWNSFSYSESLCRFDTSNQVLAQSDLWFGRRCRLKNFNMAVMAAILDF